MQLLKKKQRTTYTFPFHLFIGLLAIAILYSGCDTIASSASSPSSAALSTSSAAPTKPPETKTEAKVRAALARVNQIMQGMTLDEELGQMLLVEYVGADYSNTELPSMITQGHIGGYLYQPGEKVNKNFDPPADTIAGVDNVASQAQHDAKIPLLIAIDQEGGNVNKLSTFFGDAPSANDLGATGNSNAAYQQAIKYAQELKQTAINTDLAPVVDTGPTSNLMNIRQFSADPQVVANYSGKFLDGLQQNGIIGTLKHFPGLGSIPSGQDPHVVIPHDTQSMAQVEAKDFVPYRQLIQKNNPAMIMTTDVYLDAVDPNNPAELSSKVVTDLLRRELHYNGVIITDGIYMIERAGYMDSISASIQAVIAGNDIVEGPFTLDTVNAIIAGLKQAIHDGHLSREQVDQSVQRILLMKVQYGIIK
ncbi:MAG: glycoside hydrolase family 3 [Ktedonobacteraceae bacterium]|nr:glycoside hydrolase family 3 [Ktedonobacteraceae bacterium]